MRESVHFFSDKPPKLGERANGGVEGAIGVAGDGEGLPDDGLQFLVGNSAGIGQGKRTIITVYAQERIDGAELVESGIDSVLGFFWFGVNSDRYKRAKVRLESSGGFSGRLPWPALAAGQQKPEQGVAILPKCGKCV